MNDLFDQMSEKEFLRTEIDIFLAKYDCEYDEELTEVYVHIPYPSEDCPQKCVTWKLTAEYDDIPTITFENMESKEKHFATGWKQWELLLKTSAKWLK